MPYTLGTYGQNKDTPPVAIKYMKYDHLSQTVNISDLQPTIISPPQLVSFADSTLELAAYAKDEITANGPKAGLPISIGRPTTVGLVEGWHPHRQVPGMSVRAENRLVCDL
jgi:hypothetical protein